MDIPSHMTGTVTSVDADYHKAFVVLDGPGWGQGPAWPFDVVTHGPRDATRGTYGPLPTPGTKVLVAFPRNDLRNGVVIGSLSGTQLDVAPGQAGGVNAHARYAAEWSGKWTFDAESGEHATVFPDGSAILVGYTAVPQLNRHVLQGQVRSSQPYTQGQRVPATPSPMPFTYMQTTGAVVHVDASGAVTATAAPGQNLTANAQNATINASGTAHIMAPAINLDNGGSLLALLTAAFGTWVEGHEHIDSHGGTTTAPTTSPPPNGETSVVKGQ